MVKQRTRKISWIRFIVVVHWATRKVMVWLIKNFIHLFSLEGGGVTLQWPKLLLLGNSLCKRITKEKDWGKLHCRNIFKSIEKSLIEALLWLELFFNIFHMFFWSKTFSGTLYEFDWNKVYIHINKNSFFWAKKGGSPWDNKQLIGRLWTIGPVYFLFI